MTFKKKNANMKLFFFLSVNKKILLPKGRKRYTGSVQNRKKPLRPYNTLRNLK